MAKYVWTSDERITKTLLDQVLYGSANGESADDLTKLAVKDQSGAGSFATQILVAETLTADKVLTLALNNADRTIDLGGNVTLAGALTTAAAFITSGANSLTLTTTALTNVTLPTTGTLATLAGAEALTNKTLTTPVLASFYQDAGKTLLLTAPAATDTLVGRATTDTLTNKTLTTPVIATLYQDAGKTLLITFPAATDTVVTLAATQSLTNKTLNSGVLSGTFTGTPTFSGATITLTGGTLNFTAGAAFTLGTTDNNIFVVKTNAVDKFAFTVTLGDLTVYQATANYTLRFSDPAAARVITFADPLGNDSIAYLAASQSLTNKTLGAATLAGTLTRAADQIIDLTGAATRTLSITNSTGGQVANVSVDGSYFLANNTAFTIQLTGTPTVNRVITFPDATGTVVYTDNAQTLTSKTIGSVTLNVTAGAAFTTGTTDNFTYTIKTNAVDKFGFTVTLGDFTVYQTTANYTLRFSDPAAGRVITFADPLGNDSVAYLAAAQTLTNKTVGSVTLNVTAGAAFTTGTTDNFTYTVKTNAVDKFGFTVTLGDFTVYQATANYTLRFSDPAAGRVITFADPLGNDSVAYLAATQTLTNKTITLIGDLTLGAALDLVVAAGTAAAFEIYDATTKVYALDTRETTDNVEVHSFDATDPTIVSAAGTTWRLKQHEAITVTLTGGVGVTAMDGLSLYLSAVTLAADMATTVTTASQLYLTPVTAGANMTITNNYMINTSVAGCFLTNGGVWTSVSGRQYKRNIQTVDFTKMPNLLDKVDILTFNRIDEERQFTRFGVIADDAPDFLTDKSHKGVAGVDMAGFALAGVKWLKLEVERLASENIQMRQELELMKAV